MSYKNLEAINIEDCKKSWKDLLFSDTKEKFNIFKSKRVSEYINNVYPEKSLASNMDLSTLLIILKDRNCPIELPEYNNTTVKKERSNVEKVGNISKGKIIALKSNQSTFNFSITILDEKYREEKLNNTFEFAPRSYTLTSYDGSFNDNWKNFTFNITDSERDYFKNNIGIDGEIKCTRFVNNQLAQCMYTKYYHDMKIMIERLVAERKYLNDTKRKYLPLCKRNSDSEFELDTTTTVVKEDKEQFESIKVRCFEVKLSVVPEFNFDYIDKNMNPEEIVDICNKNLEGIVDITSEYKFLCRMIELAFTQMNSYKENLSPSDLHTYGDRYCCKWNEQKVKLPRSRIEWFELMFKDYSLLCRYFDKTIKQKII